MRKIIRPVAVAVIAASALSLTACAQTSGSLVPATNGSYTATVNKSIQVQSEEVVKTVPDKAEINYGVSSEAADPKSVQEKNSEDLNKVITFLKDSGIAETSIQTTNYGLQPNYDWSDGQKITGYQMRTSIVVSDIPMDQVGTLISSSIEAGINSISNVSYLSSKYDESYQEALKKAIESAKTKAQAMASASGKTLGEVISIEELSSYSPARYNAYENTKADTGLLSKEMAVEPGQISVQASVKISYELK
ncbi:SIMPL domain-containing protein [Clostridium sp. E02]|uniref:SIMPL domain-containing protein n=1 Tax=Clostridium sp. E02 TaxID=2487134 RepID=UPI000F54C538|nr:SIMPL domain-containing protein [Clostridium sp. E02]